MKIYPVAYTNYANAEKRSPRYVFSIDYGASGTDYFASHDDIFGVPTGTFEGLFEDYSSVSQSIDPETGSSPIGSLSVRLGDVGGAITDQLQARKAAGDNIKGKQARLWKGFEGMTWSDFEPQYTQNVRDIKEFRGQYTISCEDAQRSLRTNIFTPQKTTLTESITASAISATVESTTGFEFVEHGTSYSHGPSDAWGYFQLDDEVIGYNGRSATQFFGLERGLFGTEAAAHTVDPNDPPERRPEVTEYVYLELPIPKLVRALMTGELYGQAGATLPSTWHMGIDPALLDDLQFTGIGDDLWVPTNDSRGLIARFTGIGETDGKLFLEKECFLLAQIFAPVLPDGRLGLRRLTPALSNAPHVLELNETNVSGFRPLKHALRKLINRVIINWSYFLEQFWRQTVYIDATSIAAQKQESTKVYSFKGLASNRATDQILRQRFDAIRDRFSSPPLEISVDVAKRLDMLELGDIVKLNLTNVRDASAPTDNSISRSFEIQRITDSRNKPLKLDLFGSSSNATPIAPDLDALPDGYYDQEGIELSTVVDITAGVTDAGTFNLTGDPSLSNAVYYYDGDLTISANTLINITHNVQLRVRGFLTINGDFDGSGAGIPGVADALPQGPGGTPGFMGNTRGGNGIEYIAPDDESWRTRSPDTHSTLGTHRSFPHLNLEVVGNSIEGVPDDLRGTSGGPGGKANNALGGTRWCGRRGSSNRRARRRLRWWC